MENGKKRSTTQIPLSRYARRVYTGAAGVLLLLNQTGSLTGDTWWQTLFLGMGVIFVISGLVYYKNPAYRYGSYGKFITGTVLILVGTLFVLGLTQWCP
jgi:hypothetical protein